MMWKQIVITNKGIIIIRKTKKNRYSLHQVPVHAGEFCDFQNIAPSIDVWNVRVSFKMFKYNWIHQNVSIAESANRFPLATLNPGPGMRIKLPQPRHSVRYTRNINCIVDTQTYYLHSPCVRISGFVSGRNFCSKSNPAPAVLRTKSENRVLSGKYRRPSIAPGASLADSDTAAPAVGESSRFKTTPARVTSSAAGAVQR